MNCLQCSKQALYRNKQGQLYCYEHYWKQSEYSKPTGDKFSNSNVYRSCPCCGEGDLCDTNNCASKCLQCGIIDENRGETYCSTICSNLAQKNNITYNNQRNQSNPKKPSKAEIRKRKNNLKIGWACPHYEAEQDNDLIEACQQNNHEQALDYYLPEWKPIMKSSEDKNICADCYHDSVEYFLLVQKLTVEYVEKIKPNNYSLSSASQNAFERMKSGTLTNLDEWKEIKKQIIKEISDYKKNDSNDNSNGLNNNSNNNNRERESKKDQLQSQISNLESKPNRTPAEEQILKDKKKDLENLNNQNSELSKDKNNWLPPVLIIGGSVLVIGLIIYLIKRKSKR